MTAITETFKTKELGRFARFLMVGADGTLLDFRLLAFLKTLGLPTAWAMRDLLDIVLRGQGWLPSCWSLPQYFLARVSAVSGTSSPKMLHGCISGIVSFRLQATVTIGDFIGSRQYFASFLAIRACFDVARSSFSIYWV